MQQWVWQYKMGSHADADVACPEGRLAHCVDETSVAEHGALEVSPLCGDTPPGRTSDWSGGNARGKPYCQRCKKIADARGLCVAIA